MKPNIQEYHDYLEFLKDWIEYLKEREKGFSLRKVAKEAGIASGYLPMCFSRKRVLSLRTYEKIKPLLKLSAKEEKYLDLLRVIAESEEPKMRVQALTDLQKLKDYKESNRSELEVHQYLSRWYYVVIREMVNMPEFNGKAEWIQERLRGRVSQKEIEEALQFLVNFGFIVKNDQGKYAVVDKQLNCEEGVFKLSLGEFHRQMLDWAKLSIEETPRAERLLLGHTASLTAKQFEKVQSLLKETIGEVEIVDNKAHSADMEVYHIELTAFPLTKKKSSLSEDVGE
ncbi:DUF4423 domain-containing protein [uncultured Bdellovibrio sp.]|uniref:DUF4423 domain-containing protein n=1 Tax=Bdellovibrio sp. HCB-162 TaxID=3394234 RepID=UPI0025D1E944|nr:DUF4423 domain-containing protein [uncultured Bdellovibrio sp.]